MLSLQSTDIERILADFCLEPKARSDRKWKLKNRICHRQKTEAYVSFCELTLAVEQNYYLRLECFGAQTDMFRHIDSIMKPRNLPENPQIFPHSVLIQPNPAIVSPRREQIPYICYLGASFECERVSEHSNRRD